MGSNCKKKAGEREDIFAGQKCFTHLGLLPSTPCIAAHLPSLSLCFRNFILFSCGKGSVRPVTFPFHSHTVAFIIPYPSTACFIFEFYNPHLQGSLFSFHHFFSVRGDVCLCVHPQLLQLNLQIIEKGKKKRLNVRKTRIEFAVCTGVFMEYLLLKHTVRGTL